MHWIQFLAGVGIGCFLGYITRVLREWRNESLADLSDFEESPYRSKPR